jgi:hypothetical protein
MTPRANVVWLSPSATTFSCLCEACLDAARDTGTSFLEAVRLASVRGEMPLETTVAVAPCSAGHEVVLRRVERPPSMRTPDDRQLQLV